MLQFIARVDDKYSIPEQIQMVTEGGCAWVQLHVPDMSDEEIRELAREIVPLCKESSTILTIEDHIDLAKEIGLHGVHLVNSPLAPADVRELFGPEAIIGVQVDEACDVVPLRNLDIDYATFAPMPLERLSENVEAVRTDDIMLPLVGSVDVTASHLKQVMDTRVNGVVMSKAILDAHDPVQAVADILEALQ